MACLNHLVPKSAEAVDIGSTNGASSHRMWYPAKEVSVESLIIGALESAFWVCSCDLTHIYIFFLIDLSLLFFKYCRKWINKLGKIKNDIKC